MSVAKRLWSRRLRDRVFAVIFVALVVLTAIPVERIAYPRFHEQQWPKILARYERKREKFMALQARRSALQAGSAKRQRS